MIHFITREIKGKRKKLINAIEQTLKERGVEYAFHFTQKKTDGTEFARTLTEAGETFLVAIGGDGTFNDVLSGLADPAAVTLGLIPAGTGNDFADAARIPHGLGALELILNSEPKRTDYISFSDGRRSLNITGLGIDVDILVRCAGMKHFNVRCKYFLSLLASLCKYRGCRFKSVVNGETRTHTALIAAICNGTQFGGGIKICPPALLDDGKLDLIIADYPKRRKIPGALLKLMKGKILSVPFASHTLCERVEIYPEAPCTAQYDGELYETGALVAEVVHGGLRIFRG